jgi:hypothetical protein
VKARIVQVFAKDIVNGRNEPVEHLFLVDSDGNVHERFSDDPAGKYYPVDLPERAKRKRASAGKRR